MKDKKQEASMASANKADHDSSPWSSGAAKEERGRWEPGASGGERRVPAAGRVRGGKPGGAAAPEGSPPGRASGPACQWRQGGPCTAETEGGRGGQECRWRRMAQTGDALEMDLRRALGPVRAPAGLEERILAAVRSRGRAAGNKATRRAWRVAAPALAAGIALALLVPGFLSYRHRRAEEARAQLVFALQLTSRKLDWALERATHKTRPATRPANQGTQEAQEAQGAQVETT